MAQLALMDLCLNLGKQWFGPEFDNNVTPRFFGYFVSSPMTVTSGTADIAAQSQAVEAERVEDGWED